MRSIFFLVFFLNIFTPHFASTADLDFGRIDFVAGSGSQTFHADLNVSNGALSCNRPSDFTCEAFGSPGTNIINGSAGSQIDISCTSSASITNGSKTLDISRSDILLDGSIERCEGIETVILTHTITGVQSRDTVSWGARLSVTGGTSNLSGTFTSSGAGASPQTIRIIFI